ncbi:glutathione transferase [Caenorhabditis elegans]|uniref:glutathione transferase n=1 Tax=Caenorhabditis elegans TaxID=6239 RepID=Q9NAB3_CAEEL|nr:Glutathione S-Transferase [Caenorhabditis elegans]CAB61104.1 Glutathione S-Transferase [Caenorhabditis elegans]|eukprot:NP_497116.1 Glutathione S-Transferase [Caenorhabditis elegans]
MPSYKLTYFNVRGYGEPARILFHLADVPFEDFRMTIGDGTWENLKAKTPFGQAPVLSVDGFEIPQSAAINRYLAKQFGYAGKTPEEQAWTDAIVDQYKDFMVSIKEVGKASAAGKSAEEVGKIIQSDLVPARDAFFVIINKILEKSKSGFLVGDGLTIADIVIVECITTLDKHQLFTASEQPKLVALREKVYAIPAIKKWVEIRPDTLN